MEKKLTDEEIIKELINESNRGEWCELSFIDCVEVGVLKNALDLIYRLQSENERLSLIAGMIDKGVAVEIVNMQKTIDKQKSEIGRLTSLYDGQSGFMTSSIGDLPLTVSGLRKAVDEISRLLIVQGELQDLNVEYYNEAKDFRRENAELQKQVDELKEERQTLVTKYNQTDEAVDYWCEKYKQAVKDTAKEIYSEIGDDDILVISTQEYGKIEVVPLERLQEIIKSKGVDVE